MRYWLVVPAAGTGQRLGTAVPKQYLTIAGRTLLEWSLGAFADDPRCEGVVVALAGGDQHWPAVRQRLTCRVLEAAGGAQRADSVRNALAALRDQAGDDAWVLVHDAARPCVTRAEIDALLEAGAAAEGALLAAPLADTLKRARPAAAAASPPGAGPRVGDTAPREGLWRALTPQMFRLGALHAALQSAAAAGRIPTDEAQAMEWVGAAPRLVPGSSGNIKVTTAADLELARSILQARVPAMRIGSGVDVHAYGPGDHVMLGGVRLEHSCGVVAHSDGDVLLHALCDALLGAAGLGDIGQHFPDSDPRWRGAPSRVFVGHAVALLGSAGWRVVNADLTLLAGAPRIGPRRAEIVASIAALLGMPAAQVNLKATTTEGLGFVGRAEGLAAQASVLLAAAAVPAPP